VAGLRLKEEKEVAVLLSAIVVREEPFLGIDRVVEVTGDFILLLGNVS
jgi:hypothetical protein